MNYLTSKKHWRTAYQEALQTNKTVYFSWSDEIIVISSIDEANNHKKKGYFKNKFKSLLYTQDGLLYVTEHKESSSQILDKIRNGHLVTGYNLSHRAKAQYPAYFLSAGIQASYKALIDPSDSKILLPETMKFEHLPEKVWLFKRGDSYLLVDKKTLTAATRRNVLYLGEDVIYRDGTLLAKFTAVPDYIHPLELDRKVITNRKFEKNCEAVQRIVQNKAALEYKQENINAESTSESKQSPAMPEPVRLRLVQPRNFFENYALLFNRAGTVSHSLASCFKPLEPQESPKNRMT